MEKRCIFDRQLRAKPTQLNFLIMEFSYVICDGTSHYVVDYNEMKDLIKDSDYEVVFKNRSLDICQDEADRLNDEMYD